MADEIQLISDEDGFAVIGEQAAVELFLHTEGLASRDLGLCRLRSAISDGATLAQTGSEVFANSGRWVKMTKESAHLAKKYPAVKDSVTGLDLSVLRGANGQFVHQLRFVPGSILTNPAVLAGAAGIMAQVAMQQTMDEITDYLATIDKKVDDVLRSQKDAVLADMIGVDFVIEEAMTIREQVGRVSEVTWSKVHTTSMTIARTQAYALRQLNSLAEKVEKETQIGDLADVTQEAQTKVIDWLAVLARCFQLQEAVAVLELDRVLDASPDELDRHRRALRTARENRLALITRTTQHLMTRLDAAADSANSKTLLHPINSRTVVDSTNHVATGIIDFQGRLGVIHGRESLEATRWVDAFMETRARVLESGAEGVDAARGLGDRAIGGARGVGSQVGSSLTNRFGKIRGKLATRPGTDFPSRRRAAPKDDQ